MPGLILLPTALEFDHVAPLIRAIADEYGWRIERCGFGPIVAAARAAQLVAHYRPTTLLLVGIAGSYGDDARIGTACRFDCVVNYGVGVGESHRFVSAGQLGWPQWSDSDPANQIEDTIWLAETEERQRGANVLLTCCAGASTARESAYRHERFPNAIAEDMEGFGVAVAGRLANIPVEIVRGISNRAGDRDHRRWQITDALDAAAAMANLLIRQQAL